MVSSSLVFPASLLLCLGLFHAAQGQPPAQDPQTAGSPRDRVNQQFDRKTPPLGDPLPDVAGYDARGNEFKLRSLQGHYSVLVFGCLT